MSTTGVIDVQRLEREFDSAIARLQQAGPVTRPGCQKPVLELARQLLTVEDGAERLHRRAAALDSAGLFAGSDWDAPGSLLPSLVKTTLESGDPTTVTLDSISHLRLLSIVRGEHEHAGVSPEIARHFLTQMLALNLNRLFDTGDETLRVRLGDLAPGIDRLFRYILEHVGFEDIIGSLIDEIWRILAQRPIQVSHVRAMVTQIALVLSQPRGDIGEARLGADRLTSALFGPTKGCQDDPGIAVYRDRLAAMDNASLQQEASGFARAMHDVGLASDYHAAFLRWLLNNDQEPLVPGALGLSSTGLDVFATYNELVTALIREAIYLETAQAVYGLAMLLERGLLYSAPLAPSLWRQISLVLSADNAQRLSAVFGTSLPPRVHLLAGVINLLGLPLGVGQGNNPTCQSARAVSMWAYNDPDYLMHLIAQAARYDNIQMHFEGITIDSHGLPAGLVSDVPLDTDPVSMVLVPHLDRVYSEMGRLCSDRGEDPHRWINPEFHGWWVGRDFVIAVDVATGALLDYDTFLRRFYCSFHPMFNGNQPVIHPQPAGIAITDSNASFIGWHAVTLVRVALDQQQVMRVYFFNPNNDSGQDWGNGVVVSTQGHGERFGEASLPFAQLASRLYIFHDDPLEDHVIANIPETEIAEARELAHQSWAADRLGHQRAVS
ncbi:hypothetical protein [Chromatocurvus halotolerans]|uniref:Uncharacterized protein n=1 Tax=Chromatocurvus halotolerans TaxID=1132028 RepID=A0A4R2KZS9_9GAMM|nr:hypothetical protein [Chromatocurvus halotolerans]TCO72235.1 hypothetical protein EV688_11936 [Chromatocurvus halotolerans]